MIVYYNPELLIWLADFISGGLSAAGITTLGYTLLYVASLPLTGWYVNNRALSIAKSIYIFIYWTYAGFLTPSPARPMKASDLRGSGAREFPL